MDVQAAARGVEVMGEVLQSASRAGVEQAMKLTRVAVEMALAPESGKGEQIDISV